MFSITACLSKCTLAKSTACVANGLARCSFMDNLPRLWKEDYTPTNADIIRSRARTLGMTETSFKVSGLTLRFIDVGGQRSERRKWINFFQDVTSILFVVSLSGYDEHLVEDQSFVGHSPYSQNSFRLISYIKNQMHDALQIWDGICKSPWFTKTAFVSASAPIYCLVVLLQCVDIDLEQD